MFGLGAGEILIILVFALLFIGPKKLPELARGLGRGLREFQKAKDDIMDQVNTPVDTKESEEVAKEEVASISDTDQRDETTLESDQKKQS